MNDASPDDRWRVDQELEVVPFEGWVQTVDRIDSLRVRVERPNPHYAVRDNVRSLIEGANARLADIAWSADPEADGLDINEPLIRETIDHSAQYGSYSASGERKGRTTQWGSEQQAAAEQREVEADPRTREVSTDNLREQLGDDESRELPESTERTEGER